MKKQYLVAAAGVLLVVAFAAAAFVYETKKANERAETTKQHASILVRDYSPTIGDPNAKVVIAEFFDPGCEACRAFHPFVKQLMAANPGKIKLVMRYTPFHAGSDQVVKMLEASRLQDKFWETLEATYAAQAVWASHGNPQPDKLWMRLGQVGLDFAQLRQDMQGRTIEKRMQQDMADAKQLQVTKTPSFFVNGKPLTSFGYQQLQNLVEREIGKNY